ncbi:MAG TPA: bifunctional phosphopantothenoylcysteine decarboxylase/phosphopantothenate--cysteine ligase CoaBC [Baekduia sp.]|nr:bifunctional phosphopantothenoylcysteine decarboxylase/phosphopantothenate--cysteine ligase CoaBC [Baekduia sp.]
MARILLGVTGGVAAYKALEFARLAIKAGDTLRVIQTANSQRFVGTDSFAAITGAPVLTSEFERDPLRGSFPGQPLPEHDPASHLELVRRADIFVIAPASANTIAKLAAGIADNLLTSAALAATCPVVVAPAMNNNMWANAATNANVETLKRRGLTIVEPTTGDLATRNEYGMGRLAEPADLLAAVRARMPGGQRPWDGLKVLVTAGGTREPIDAVRYVGNRSSGRMGIALAGAAAALGADVTLIAANIGLPVPPSVHRIDVETAADLADACKSEFPSCDVLLMAAAVADFRPSAPAAGKLKKSDRPELIVPMSRTDDVLTGLAAARQPGQTVVGFAAETGADALANARGKLERKHLDAVILNDIGRPGIGFDSEDNAVTILTATGDTEVPIASKAEVAKAILQAVSGLRSSVRSRA